MTRSNSAASAALKLGIMMALFAGAGNYSASQEPTVIIKTGKNQSIRSLAFSHDSKLLAFGCGNSLDSEEVRVWDVNAKREVYRFKNFKGQVNSVAISPDSCILAAAGGFLRRASDITLWDLKVGAEIGRRLQGHSEMIECLAFSLDGKLLFSDSQDKTVRLWDVMTHKELACFRGHAGGVTSITISPDGKTLASASFDMTIRLWDITSRKELMKLRGHKDAVRAVVFSPNGKFLASIGLDEDVKLWKVATGKDFATWEPHPQSVLTAIAFSSDGKLLATGGGTLTKREEFSGEIGLWDTATQKLIRRIGTYTDNPPVSVAFSPNGKLLASACHDNDIKIWELRSLLKQ